MWGLSEMHLIFISLVSRFDSRAALTAKQGYPPFLRDLLYLAIPVLGAIAAGSAALYGRAAVFSAGPEAWTLDAASTILFSMALLGILFYWMKRYPEKSARLLVAAVAIAGTISGLILLRISLEASGAPPAVFLVTLPLGYMGLNWSVRGYFRSLSPRRTTGLMVGSSTLLGALIGTSLSPAVAITFLVMLTILDVIVVGCNTVPGIVGRSGYDQVVSVVTLQLEKYVVGIGDFLAYSILSSAALRILGLYGAIETSILILLGIAVTFQVTKTTGRAPGLLLPISLGLTPLVLGLPSIWK